MMITAADFYEALAEGTLIATRCADCDGLYIPPRSLCPACYGTELKVEELSGKGTVGAYTAVAITTTRMIEAGYGRDNPNITAVVDLAEGVRISALIHGDDITVGTPVVFDSEHSAEHVVFRKDDS
ncbi:MAG: Zn-ribbon domain-containing OB-fold protein [Anaerolineae bacterium]